MRYITESRRKYWQLFRYLVVGAWNTLFGYGVFALFTHLLRHILFGYLIALVVANVLAISVAFIAYKRFVFQTKGGYLREWLKSMAVYGTGMLLNLLLLAPLVALLRRQTSLGGHAPYVAQAFLAVFVVMLSFLGHKHYTFRQIGKEPISSER